MSTTTTLGGSIGYAQSFLGFRGLTIGVNSEPAVTAANIILLTVISPPFSWNWNRGLAVFTTVPGQQDYTVPVSQFGFIEKAGYQIPSATITNTVIAGGVATYTANNSFQAGDVVTVTGTTNGSGIFNVQNQPILAATPTQFTITNSGAAATSADTGTAVVGTTSEVSQVAKILGSASEQSSTNQIAAQVDDNAGNITFRLLPAPNRVYNMTVTYQKKPLQLMTGTSSTWAPIPDQYEQIYTWGFLALMMAYSGDSRWVSMNQKFVSSLLGIAEGLTDQDREVFQQSWLDMVTEQQTRGLKAPQGVQARNS
jgi:hypothetical protein